MTLAGPAAASTQSGVVGKEHAAPTGMAINSATKAGVAGYLRWEPGSDPTTTYNSTGGQVFVTQLSAGDTLVTFAGVTGNGGDAQVSTPITNASCSVEFVTPVVVNAKPGRQSATEHAFLVQCYDQSGTQTDEPFDLLVTHAPSHPQGVLDYAWVYKTHGSLNSDPKFRPFEFNSAGKTNSVSHPRTGVYLVTMPGSGSAGNSRGTVSVSPVGAGAGNCQVATWQATKTAQKITVACFSATGAPMNRQFTVAYARGNNLMGRGGLTDANASVHSGGSVYQPSTQFDSVAKAKITVAHTNPGQYVVLFGGSRPTGRPNGGNGHIQVTAAGSRPRHCGYTIIPTPTPELDVNCATPGGILTDSAFTVQWVVSR
jgi:hypothetical protein